PDRDGRDRDAVAVHAGRLQGLRRVGVGERAGGGRERGRGSAPPARPEAHAPAPDAGPLVGADAVKPAPFEYHRPGTLDEALALLEDPDAKPLAGGQSLVPMRKFRPVAS